MIATWLMNSVSKKIGQSLLFISTAEGIWKNLLSCFKQDDAPRVYDLEQRLSSIEQGNMDVSAYYTELITLWEEHKNYVELPVCTCGRCECDAAALWEKLQQRSRVTKFLMGLNESYEQTRRHILMLKPIPTIEEAFNIVTQDERQKALRPSTRIDNVAFQLQSIPPSSSTVGLLPSPAVDPSYVAAYNTSRQAQRPICTHCGKSGHTVQKCFKLHGFPPGYKTNGNYYRNQSKVGASQNAPPLNQSSPAPTNAIANVHSDLAYSSSGASCVPYATTGTSITLQDFTPQ